MFKLKKMFSKNHKGYEDINNDTVVLFYTHYHLLYTPMRAALYGYEKTLILKAGFSTM